MEQTNYFDWLIATRDMERKRRQTSKVVIKGSEKPWEWNGQGKMRWYMHPAIEDTATKFFLFRVQEIPPAGRSGKLLIPGGQVIYFWEGRGYTVLDGERFDWEGGDLLQVPVRPDGVTFQHFNTDPEKIAKLVIIEANHVDAVGVDKGSCFEVLEKASP